MPKLVFDSDDGRVLASLRKQRQEFGAIKEASEGVARAERQRAQATNAASRAAGGHAPTGARQVSIIGRLLGGEAGGLLREGAHFSHLIGGFAVAGAAALAVGAAFKAIGAASERAVDAAREETRVRLELRDAIKSASKAADTAAIGTFTTHREALQTLAATGGDSAVARAQGLAARFGPGAIEGMAALAGRPGGIGGGDLDAVISAARTGRVGFAAAAQAVAGGNVSASGSADERAAQILSATLGRAVNAGDVRSFQANLSGSRVGRRTFDFDAAQGGLANAGIDRFASSDTLIAGITRQTSDLADPAGAATREISQKLEEQIEIQKSAADAQWRMVGAFESFLGFFGGGGSEGDKLSRLRATAAVVQ